MSDNKNESACNIGVLTDDNGNSSSTRIICFMFACASILFAGCACYMAYKAMASTEIPVELSIWFAGFSLAGKTAGKLIEMKFNNGGKK